MSPESHVTVKKWKFSSVTRITSHCQEMEVFQCHQNHKSLEMDLDRNFQHLELACRLSWPIGWLPDLLPTLQVCSFLADWFAHWLANHKSVEMDLDRNFQHLELACRVSWPIGWLPDLLPTLQVCSFLADWFAHWLAGSQSDQKTDLFVVSCSALESTFL